MFLSWVKDDWLVSETARRTFFLSTILTFVLTLIIVTMSLAKVENMNHRPFPERLAITLLAMAGTVGWFHIWLGMWRYWVRLDKSSPFVRRVWFMLLLLGWSWASSFYYFLVYVPQVRSKLEE
jgi:hypothetical protein